MRKMKRLIVGTAAILILFVLGFLYWIFGNQPADPQSREEKIFVIPQGATVREIGNSLAEEGLIKDPVVFFVYIKLNGMDRNIQAGDYKLSASMRLSEIVDNLNHGTVDVWVTFPEGIRAEEMADILSDKVPSYDESWRAQLSENEGYLFPDTYLIPVDADAATVVSILRNNFFAKVAEIGLDEDSSKLEDTVIMASLIEREAITDEEKPLIAGILHNRLDIGMALQVDATIQYAKGYNTRTKKWWEPITLDEYTSVDSAYNTYQNPGLPPGPISNPGIEAIRAALNPASTSMLFYLHDSEGQIHTAETLAEHNTNVARFIR